MCGPPWNQISFPKCEAHLPPPSPQSSIPDVDYEALCDLALSQFYRLSITSHSFVSLATCPTSHALESLLLPLPCSFLLLSLGTCQSLHVACSPPPPMNSWLPLAPRLDHMPSGTPCPIRPGWLLLHVPTTLCASPIRILTALSCTHSLAVLCISPEAVQVQWPHPRPSS